MWNGTLVMISFAGLGEAMADGEDSGVGDRPASVRRLASCSAEGEAPRANSLAAGWSLGAGGYTTKTSPATHAAGTTPLLLHSVTHVLRCKVYVRA